MPGPEILIVVAVIAILFGGSKIPQFARSLGSAKNEFEKGASGDGAPVPVTTSAAVPVTTKVVAADTVVVEDPAVVRQA